MYKDKEETKRLEAVLEYHLTRLLKGLQDQFDKSQSTKSKVDIAIAMDKLLDNARMHIDHPGEFR